MSTKAHTVDALSTRRGEVFAWRLEQLRARRFEDALAAELAADGGFDLHALIELVEQGCRPNLAARILAPILEEARPC